MNPTFFSQERRREDERRRTQEIKFTKEDMERVRLNMNGDYSKVPASARELDSQSRWVTLDTFNGFSTPNVMIVSLNIVSF